MVRVLTVRQLQKGDPSAASGWPPRISDTRLYLLIASVPAADPALNARLRRERIAEMSLYGLGSTSGAAAGLRWTTTENGATGGTPQSVVAPCCTPEASESLAALLRQAPGYSGASPRLRWGQYVVAVAALCPPPAAVAPELRSMVQCLISGYRTPPPLSSARITLAIDWEREGTREAPLGALVRMHLLCLVRPIFSNFEPRRPSLAAAPRAN